MKVKDKDNKTNKKGKRRIWKIKWKIGKLGEVQKYLYNSWKELNEKERVLKFVTWYWWLWYKLYCKLPNNF